MDWVTFPCMDYVKRGGKMSGETFIALKENAKKYIESYEAVQTLKRNYVIDDDFYQEIRNDILDQIIDSLRNVVNE